MSVQQAASYSKDDRAKAKAGVKLSILGGAVVASVKALGFILRPLFGGQMWGLYAIAWAVIELLSFFILGGFNDAIVLYAARAHHATDDVERRKAISALGTLIKVPFLLALVIAVAMQLLAPFLQQTLWQEHDLLLSELLSGLGWTLPLMVLLQVPAESTRAQLRFGVAIGLVQIAFPLGSYVAATLCYFLFEPSILSIVYGTIISLICCIPFSIFFFIRSLKEKRVVRTLLLAPVHWESLSFAFPQSLNMALNQGLNRIDSIMLSFFGVSANTIGIYSLVSDLTQVIRLGKMAFSGIYSPVVAKYRALQNHAGIQVALNDTLKKTTGVGFLLFVLISGLWPLLVLEPGEELVNRFFWVFLCVGPMMSVCFGLAGNTLLMTGHSKLLLKNALICGSINVGLNAILIPFAGVLGASIATSLAAISISLLQLTQMIRLENIRPIFADYQRSLLALLAPLLLLGTWVYGQPLRRSNESLWTALQALDHTNSDVLRSFVTLCAIVTYALGWWLVPRLLRHR